MVLLEGELLRLPRSTISLSVLSGYAWVSYRGEDIVLAPGRNFVWALHAARDAVVPTVGGKPLVFELA